MATGGAQVLAFNGITQPLAWFPFVGWISRHYRRANFAELLALMIEHEVPLPEGLRLAAESTGDARLQRSGWELAAAIERGDLVATGPFATGTVCLLFCIGFFRVGSRGRNWCGCCVIRRRSIGGKRLNLSRWFRTLFPVVAAVVHWRRSDGRVRDHAVRAFGAHSGSIWESSDMRNYTYIAINSRGERISGEVEATDPDAVVSRLSAQGCASKACRRTAPREPAPPARELTTQLSAAETREVGGHISEIISAGVPLEAGLAAIADEFPWGRVRRTLRGIVRDLESGEDLESVLSHRHTAGYLPALVAAAGAALGPHGRDPR